MKKYNSRRNFLSFISLLALLFTSSVTLFPSKKINDDEEYVFLNGWLLKKKDLNDL